MEPIKCGKAGCTDNAALTVEQWFGKEVEPVCVHFCAQHAGDVFNVVLPQRLGSMTKGDIELTMVYVCGLRPSRIPFANRR